MGAGLGLTLALTLPGQALAQPPAASTTNGDLSVSVRDAARIAGQYGLAGSLVSFDARRTDADRMAVTLTVNGETLDATFDLAARTGSWTGHGAILGTEGKTVLTGMERALAAEIRPAREPAPHEAMLYRLVMLWAEAPAGLVLTGATIDPPDERTGERPLVAGADVPSGSPGGQPSAGGPGHDPAAAGQPALERCLDAQTSGKGVAACQRDDDNGIWYFPDHLCDGGTTGQCHDADSHCWTCANTQVGEPYNCKGRCGGGCCVPDGLGIFTYDCLDHDHCCGVHGGCWNPWDGECGDEYFDADDDFLWGTTNCGAWVC